tara:strand:- start:444 stop:1157 length:714 start_codon:yes stop_codon:yes gene_type:complete
MGYTVGEGGDDMAEYREVFSWDWESPKAVGVDVKLVGITKPTRVFLPKSMIETVNEVPFAPAWMIDKKLERSTPESFGSHFGAVIEMGEPEKAAPETVEAGNVLAFFEEAATRVKFPKVRTASLKFTRSGSKAKVPGGIVVTDHGDYPDNKFYGRIGLDGKFIATRSASPEVIARVEEFNADPAGFATKEGKLNGRCVFCFSPIGAGDDRRSIEMGYGPVCAAKYHVPWGTAATKAA